MKWVLGLIGALASLGITLVVIVFALAFFGDQAGDTTTASSSPNPSTSTDESDTARNAGSASSAPGAANDDQLHYDAAKVHRSEREANAEFQTRECLSQYSKTLLMEGLRDRTIITEQAISVCGRVLSIVMTQDGQKPEAVASRMRALEDEELDAVVSEGQ